ncbi:hypothetical protein P691DRAFT_287062 [Macrolepiota fuliginosa MF-IS2]|uniref:Uncharacterized protein n=1 Tax=Macrolepiota fuliginosa MF-IS2 TaxID=1400762 RepID=A0A9P5XKA8_9AGAR|nr:hypothetical protein P691DRAFT_287062 [Macrolepiota fuliginosa MF-IS2]
MEAGSKRKRDLECPRITYHTPERTFDRLFREDSLAQLKQVARKKLGLQADAVIDLSQIRGDTCIDLEDEDDFDAFYNAVHSSSTASIRVTIRDGAIAKNAKNKETPEKKRRRLVDVSQSSAAGTLLTSTPGPVSRKRAVSIAQSGANKTSEVQTAEPPAKRTKTTSTPSSEQPADSAQQLARFIDTPAPPPPAEFSKQGDTSDKAKATPNTAPGPPLTVAASISTSSPTAPVTNKGKPTPKAAPKLASKVVASSLASSSTTPVLTPGAPIPTATPGADVNKSAKPVSEQAADVSTVQEHLSGLQDGALEAQGKAREKEKEVKVKVTREKKPKNKSKDKPKGIEDGKGKLPPAETVEGPATSETSETAAPTVQPPQAKETISSAPAGQKDTKSKSKKAKSITSKDPLEVGAADKPKKKAKSKVRESSSAVNSETNDAVTADSQAEASNISAISRSIIEKYLTPSSPSSVVDAEDVAVQLASAIQASHGTTVKVTALPRPTCPYCGKSLTHDRSHCPLIRAKLPETIERRIAELKKDTSADPEGVRAKAIDVLKLAVQRKRGGETKKEKGSTVNSNVNS